MSGELSQLSSWQRWKDIIQAWWVSHYTQLVVWNNTLQTLAGEYDVKLTYAQELLRSQKERNRIQNCWKDKCQVVLLGVLNYPPGSGKSKRRARYTDFILLVPWRIAFMNYALEIPRALKKVIIRNSLIKFQYPRKGCCWGHHYVMFVGTPERMTCLALVARLMRASLTDMFCRFPS